MADTAQETAGTGEGKEEGEEMIDITMASYGKYISFGRLTIFRSFAYATGKKYLEFSLSQKPLPPCYFPHWISYFKIKIGRFKLKKEQK